MNRQLRDITVREAAAILGVSPRTVFRLITRGALQPVGERPMRVAREDVEELRRRWQEVGRNPYALPRGRPRKCSRSQNRRSGS